jgi:hypothetical protein
VSDDSYVAKVVTTILNGLHHRSLLGSNPILSSDNPPPDFAANRNPINVSLIRLTP